jgi:hypothetical protein
MASQNASGEGQDGKAEKLSLKGRKTVDDRNFVI